MFSLPLGVKAIMNGFKSDWFIAGGWAIDLFLEKETRPHDASEIAIFRKDQNALQNYLNGWLLQKAENNKLSVWKREDFLELPIHEIHCFNELSEPKSFEVLLNESDGDQWIYRRNKEITKPLSKVYLKSNLGMKFLCPEIVLLYKSKNSNDKDEKDFENAVKNAWK